MFSLEWVISKVFYWRFHRFFCQKLLFLCRGYRKSERNINFRFFRRCFTRADIISLCQVVDFVWCLLKKKNFFLNRPFLRDFYGRFHRFFMSQVADFGWWLRKNTNDHIIFLGIVISEELVNGARFVWNTGKGGCCRSVGRTGGRSVGRADGRASSHARVH